MELIGRRFGHIRVTDVVGQGGMGDVYAAYDEKLERKVALKVLNADQRLDSEARERLLREARALSRLDHPNICRIHDYIESDEVDLLVLEFIDGRTLYDAEIEKMTRREKLRISIRVAEVLVAAHRAGIVHRDLKPENVMLTASGEVKVLDFGLARWLTRARTMSSDRFRAISHAALSQSTTAPGTAPAIDSDTLVLASVDQSGGSSTGGRREFLATAVGITLGTPLFMSPEQARGDSLTPASDMFSFGLLLQWLFTGKEPHPDGVTARDAILRVARGDTLPVQGAPADITSFIQRLKSFAPTDRPTAVEGVERLQFLDAKPQRIARRSLIAALVTIAVIGVWRYTVDLKREQAKAIAAQSEAQQRRVELENMLEFMLGDLRQKLDPVGRLDILDDVGERALHYAESLRPDAMSADDLVRNAKALNQLGEVRVQQGKLVDALTVFNKSLRLADAAVKRDPKSGPAQLALATSHFWVGDVHRRQGELEPALDHYMHYMTGAEALAKQFPNNSDYQLERAYGHSNVASIYELQGDYTRAFEQLSLTYDVKRALFAGKPADAGRQADLARTSNRIGFVLERSGDLDGARRHYESEFATYSALVAADPNNTKWKDRLVVSHNFLAHVSEMTGDVDRALELRRHELILASQLVARDGENTMWQRNLAMTQTKYGDVLRQTGDVQGALQSIAEGEKTMQRLLTRTETIPSWRRDLGSVLTAMSRAQLAAGNTGGAVRSAQAALASLQPLAATDALIPRYIADAWLALGEAHAAARNASAARAAWEKGEQILGPLARDSRSPEVLDIMARTLLRLGRRDQADTFIQRLQVGGYRAHDFVRATS